MGPTGLMGTSNIMGDGNIMGNSDFNVKSINAGIILWWLYVREY